MLMLAPAIVVNKYILFYSIVFFYNFKLISFSEFWSFFGEVIVQCHRIAKINPWPWQNHGDHIKRNLKIMFEQVLVPVFYDLWFDTILPLKKKTNKHTSIIFLLWEKQNNILYFVDWSLKPIW